MSRARKTAVRVTAYPRLLDDDAEIKIKVQRTMFGKSRSV